MAHQQKLLSAIQKKPTQTEIRLFTGADPGFVKRGVLYNCARGNFRATPTLLINQAHFSLKWRVFKSSLVREGC